MPNEFVFANFMVGELLDPITTITTELRVSPSVAAKLELFGVASQKEARLTLWDGQSDPEIVGCLANPQTGVLTVTRAQEETTAVAWPAGTQVRCAITREVIERAMLATINLQEVLQQAYLPLSGGTLTGPLILDGTTPTVAAQATPKSYVDSVLGDKLPLAGGTMLGSINMNGNRLLSLVAAVSDSEPMRRLEVLAIQDLLAKVDTDRSGSLITSGSASNFTLTSASTITTLSDGLSISARVHTINNLRATLNLNSIGAKEIQIIPGEDIPYAILTQDIPYQFVYSLGYDAWLVKGGLHPPVSTGDYKLTTKTIADLGWILLDDGSIGNVVSGASYASQNYENLFIHMWDTFSNALCPVSTGRGASGLIDFNAGKVLTMSKFLGRALGIAGAGSGLTTRTSGSVLGSETQQILVINLPVTSFTVTIGAGQGSHGHAGSTVNLSQGANVQSAGTLFSTDLGTTPLNIALATLPAMTGTAASGGSGSLFSIMPPMAYTNIMIKI